jgi:transcriptional regulator with XRE-family HTH domain
MNAGQNLRSRRVGEKGPLHARLHRLLHEAWQRKDITQESLGQAIGKSQENAGQYLRGTNAGALDLDQAAAALHHIGSSMEAFLANTPPRSLTETELLVRALDTRPELKALLEDLLRVPRPRLGAILELVRGLVPIAIGPRAGPTGGSPTGTPRASRTKSGPKPRPRVPGHKTPK